MGPCVGMQKSQATKGKIWKHHFVRMKVEVFRTQEVVKRAFKLQA